MNADDKLLWSIPEFSARIGLGRTKTYELFARREVCPVRIDRRTFVPAAEARRWLEALRAKAEAEARNS